MRHGYTAYAQGWCRCAICTDANAAYAASRKAQRKATDVYATPDEVRLWASSIGFTIHPNFRGRVASVLIERYNREHPDRPYVSPVERPAAS